METHFNFNNKNKDIRHQAQAQRLTSEMAEMDFSKMTKDEAIKALTDKYGDRNFGLGSKERPVLTGKFKDGQQFQLELNGEGKIIVRDPAVPKTAAPLATIGETSPALAQATAAPSNAPKDIAEAKQRIADARSAIEGFETQLKSAEEEVTKLTEAKKGVKAGSAEESALQTKLDDATRLRDELKIKQQQNPGLYSQLEKAEADVAFLQKRYDVRPNPHLQQKLKDAQSKVEGFKKQILEKEKDIRNAYLSGGKLVASEGFDSAIKFLQDRTTVKLFKEGIRLTGELIRLPVTVTRKLANLLDWKLLQINNTFIAANSVEIIKLLRFVYQNEAAPQYQGDSASRMFAEFTKSYLNADGQLLQKLMPDFHMGSADTPAEKMDALERAWAKLDTYNTNEKTYISNKQGQLASAISGLQPGATAADITTALDQRFGLGLNDMGKAYQVSFDGITVKVAADGSHTYEGIDQWVSLAPKRTAVIGTFTETAQKYASMNKADLAKSNNNKPVGNAQEYRTMLAEQIKASLVTKLGGQDLSQATTIISTERTADGKPVFTANINEKGQITVDVNEGWSKTSFDAIQAKPLPKPAPKSTPKSGPKTASKGKKAASIPVDEDARDAATVTPKSNDDDIYT